ncbi:MAG: site-specific integrase [Fibrobacteres bacterium]|nr:site-specific integrase [Fibrobacterota bacterium]
MGVKKTRRGWAIDYYRHGKRVQEFIGQSKTLAHQALSRVKAELATDKFFPDRPKGMNLKLSEILNLYWNEHLKFRKCAVKYGYFYAFALKEFGCHTIDSLTKETLEKWLQSTVYKQKVRNSPDKPDAKLKPATVNRVFQLLCAAINHALKIGHICGVKNPCSLVKKLPENNVRDITIDRIEFDRLTKEMPEHLKPIVSFAYFTGCRKSEILNLMKSDVDFFRNVVFIRDTKNNESRYVPIASELKETLLDLINKCPESLYLFNHKDGSRVRQIKKGFRSGCSRAGLDRLHFHDLRHTALTNWHNVGHSHFTIMQASGHKTLSCFQRYLSFRNSDLQKLVFDKDSNNMETGQERSLAKAM